MLAIACLAPSEGCGQSPWLPGFPLPSQRLRSIRFPHFPTLG